MEGGGHELSDQSLERELAIVAALRDAGATAGPSSDEVDRMRKRIMAGFAHTDFADDSSSRVALFTVSRPGRHARHRAPTGAEARGRMVVAAAAALCLLMSLSGMSLLLSRDALPGDALYNFKRSAESAELGLTFGDESRALKHLEFATARLDEIAVLAAEDFGAQPEATRFVGVLDDFDDDAAAGAWMLTDVAAAGDPEVLASLLGWIEQQRARLDSLRAALPVGAESRLASSLGLLTRVENRVEALEARSQCTNVVSGATDDLGPLPAEEPCVRAALDESASATSLPQDGREPGILVPGVPAAPSAPVPGAPPLDPNAPAAPERPQLSDVLAPPNHEIDPANPGPDEPPQLLLPLPLPPPISPPLPELEEGPNDRPGLVPERSGTSGAPGIR